MVHPPTIQVHTCMSWYVFITYWDILEWTEPYSAAPGRLAIRPADCWLHLHTHRFTIKPFYSLAALPPRRAATRRACDGSSGVGSPPPSSAAAAGATAPSAAVVTVVGIHAVGTTRPVSNGASERRKSLFQLIVHGSVRKDLSFK